MATPNRPVLLTKQLHQIVDTLSAINDHYKWAYYAASQPIRTGSGLTGKLGGGFHVSDPTASVVCDPRNQRLASAVRTASEAVLQARDALYRAEQALRQCWPPDSHGPSGDYERARISQAELAEAREAQARRKARGEGWGEG